LRFVKAIENAYAAGHSMYTLGLRVELQLTLHRLIPGLGGARMSAIGLLLLIVTYATII